MKTKTKLTKEESNALVAYMREHRGEHPTNRSVFAAGIAALNLQDTLTPQNSNCARYVRKMKSEPANKRPGIQRQRISAPASLVPQDGILNGNGHALAEPPHSVTPMSLDHCPKCKARFYIAEGGE